MWSLGWFGMVIQGLSRSMPIPDLLPDDINITRYQGSAELGLLVLSDLERERLEIKWRKLPGLSGQKQWLKILARIKTRSPISEIPNLPPNMHGFWVDQLFTKNQTTHGGGLLKTPHRLFEVVGTDRPLVESVLQHLTDLWSPNLKNTFLPWQLYGIRGIVPGEMKLTKITLLPGRSQLEFGIPGWHRLLRMGRGGTVGGAGSGGAITLGSWSRAYQLLGGGSLSQWATTNLPLLKRPGTTLTTQTDTQANWSLRHGKGHLRLELDPTLNVLRWIQITGQSTWISRILAAQDPTHSTAEVT